MNLTLLIILFILSQLIFLLPIKDRRSRQFGFPWMTATIVAINVLIHSWLTWRFADSQEATWRAIYPFMEVPRLILDREGLGALSSLTSTFLHANWQHLLGNMLFLWFFGRKIEDATGPIRFSLFYLLCGFSANVFDVIVEAVFFPANTNIPGLGASGAIAGVMAAYLFLYSDQRILTFVSTWLAPLIPVPGGCLIPVPIPIWMPAWVFLVYKFMSDALLGELALEIAKHESNFHLGIGVFAHLGGALGGLIFIYFFLHPEVLAQRR